ncbi:hypothetical protein ACJRO7_004410 [Eucalyptus globulus]|uniref:Uncharacterized protein n=1 Tax=Eucalyptus globulus TaxID=34317 RepID=A0ABD3J166_EUCGL
MLVQISSEQTSRCRKSGEQRCPRSGRWLVGARAARAPTSHRPDLRGPRQSVKKRSEQVHLVKEQRLSAPERTTVEKPDGLETEAAVGAGEWEAPEKMAVEKMEEERLRCSKE